MRQRVKMFRLKTSPVVVFTLLATVSLCMGISNAQNSYDDELDYDDRGSLSSNGPVYRPVPQPPTSAQASQRDRNVIVVPRLGLVRGNIGYKRIDNRLINSFLGLKYGVVRPGIGRFQKASPVYISNNEVIDATRTAANCPQFPDLDTITISESHGQYVDDCLTLNIYTPNASGSYPVMVFVHGEMLFDGSAEEGQPDYLLRHDVVLVSINYRLAPFGFLSTLSEEMPGNVALSDIQLALEWIQQHIRPFGGNPDHVTLFGQAGGATLVHALSLSGKAQGLFHKVILQSGTALNPYFWDENPIETVRSFARQARCPSQRGREIENINSCLARLSTTELLNIFKKHWEENEARGLRFAGGFKLIVGDQLGYITAHPAALVAQNTYPTIAGVAKDAGAFILSRFYNQLEQVRSRNISDYIDVVLKHTAQPRHYAIWKHLAIHHIFTEEDVRNPNLYGLAQGLLELINLILYRAPVIDSIRYTSRRYPTYLYVFDYRGEFHRFGHLRNPLPFEADATLSDDNIYLFPYPEEVSQLNADDNQVARTLSAMWANFASYNSPNVNAGYWPNVTSEYGPFLRFSNDKRNPLELDYHFGEGISIPNLYPEYFTTTTSTTSTTSTTTTTTTVSPPYPNHQNNYPYPGRPYPYQPYDYYPNDPNAQSQQQQPYYSRPDENVLNDPYNRPPYQPRGQEANTNYPQKK